MKQLLPFLFILSLFSLSSRAQERKLVQFSGIVYNSDTTKAVIPYVTAYNKTRKQTYPANYQGYFSFVAQEQDTIVFSAIGFSKEGVVIPTGLPDMKYTVFVSLKPESITLPTVQIYPWATVDEFTRAFLSMKLADDELLIAKKNVSRESLSAMARVLPHDAREMDNINFQNNHIALSSKNMNMRAANPLLNPFAWAAFIQQITKGDKSRGTD